MVLRGETYVLDTEWMVTNTGVITSSMITKVTSSKWWSNVTDSPVIIDSNSDNMPGNYSTLFFGSVKEVNMSVLIFWLLVCLLGKLLT